MAAVRGLKPRMRKAAFAPPLASGRFRKMLDRFCGLVDAPESRQALLASANPFAEAGAEVGLRSKSEIEARIQALRADAKEAPISSEERALIDAILGLEETLPNVLSQLQDIAVDMPELMKRSNSLRHVFKRWLIRAWISKTSRLRATMGGRLWSTTTALCLAFIRRMGVIAMGGRYDALTAQLGGGVAAPAVGGVIRPDLLLSAKGEGVVLKLGVPSKGRLMEKTFDWFGSRGVTLRKSGHERAVGAVEGVDGLKLVLLSASEIPRELSAGRIPLGVTGSDLVREKLVNWDDQVAELALMGFGGADLIIAVPKFGLMSKPLMTWMPLRQRFGQPMGFVCGSTSITVWCASS